MPHHYLNSGLDEPPHNGVHKRVSSLLKLNDDVNTDNLHFSLPMCLGLFSDMHQSISG